MSDAPLDDLLARLERERLAADRAYHEALSAVDRAIRQPPALPHAPAALDHSQATVINESWNILAAAPAVDPADRSIRGRLRAFIWRLAGPPLETQRRFNAAITDHLNRNLAALAETQQATAELVAVARDEFSALAAFESVLVQYLQTITLYIDSKDRSLGGSDLRDRLARTEQRILALKREVEAGLAGGAVPAAGARPAEGQADAAAYVEFQDRFRGSQAEIRGRVDDYLPILASATDVVDIGCGRGELVERLRDAGVRARGVDANPAMVEVGRARGLDVVQGDAVGFLREQPDGSLGGLVAIQVVEHLPPTALVAFLEAAYHAMRAGAPLVLETINPACWMAFFETYIRDLTHQRPLHPDTLRYLVEAAGFSHVDVRFREPVREADRLSRVAAPSSAPGDVVAALNDHADKLNARLFSFTDYAIVARR